MNMERARPSCAGAAGSGVDATSDCVIISKGGVHDPDGLKVRQVIEALAYHPSVPTVRIILLFVTENGEDAPPARCRVTHRGGVDCRLCRVRLGSSEERLRILRQLYADRIKRDPKQPKSLLFYPRVNCLGVSEEPIRVSVDGPGGCLRDQDKIELTAELAEAQGEPPFSAFVVPPSECQPIQPGETAIWRLDLEIRKESYLRLLRDPDCFSVDSYRWLLRDIEACDLPKAGDERFEGLYNEIRDSVIAPGAYDIVVFQRIEGAEPVEVRSGSIRITPGEPTDPDLARQVLWFFGQREEFYLTLGYSREAGRRQHRQHALEDCGDEQHASKQLVRR